MRYLGIDYGSKRIGIAVSDEDGKFALPHSVIENAGKSNKEKRNRVLEKIAELVKDQSISEIVLGESTDFKGNDNVIMKDIREFKTTLEEKLSLPVHYETELLSSHQAASIQGKHDLLDASAAAIILQSYLDKTASPGSSPSSEPPSP